MNVDRAEAAFWSTWIRNRNVDAGTAADGAVPVAGGFALCLAGTAVVYGLGVGSTRPLRADDCSILRDFYGRRGLAPRLELHDAVWERDGAVLREAGYAESEPPLAILEAPADAGMTAPSAGVTVRLTTDRRAWTGLLERAFDAAARDDDAERVRRTLQATAASAQALFIASIDGTDVGAAAATLMQEYVLLSAGAVLPGHRRRGAHRALIAARLAFGRERGALNAAVKVVPDSAAEQSAALAGFRRSHLRRRLTSS